MTKSIRVKWTVREARSRLPRHCRLYLDTLPRWLLAPVPQKSARRRQPTELRKLLQRINHLCRDECYFRVFPMARARETGLRHDVVLFRCSKGRMAEKILCSAHVLWIADGPESRGGVAE